MAVNIDQLANHVGSFGSSQSLQNTAGHIWNTSYWQSVTSIWLYWCEISLVNKRFIACIGRWNTIFLRRTARNSLYWKDWKDVFVHVFFSLIIYNSERLFFNSKILFMSYLIKTWNYSKHEFAQSKISQLIWRLQFLETACFLVVKTLLFPRRQVSSQLFGLEIRMTGTAS